MSADLEQIRWWSWRRQRLDRTCRGIDDCLRSIVGVRSSNPQGALSLLARVPRLMPGMVDGAIDAKIALRVPAMRRAVWMLHAETAHLALRAAHVSPVKTLLSRAGITETEYARLEREVLLAAGRGASAEVIREAITNPPPKLGPVLQALCGSGKLLQIKAKTPLSNAFTFAATSAWLGKDLPETDSDDALAWLAGDYLKAFGPASVADFGWWSGVPDVRAERAVLAHDPEDIGGGLYMWPGELHALEGTRSVANRVNLLPALDPYTMGYAEPSRARFADPKLLPFLYDQSGNSTSVILVDGAVQGLWDFTLSNRTIQIRIAMFDTPTPRAMGAIEAEAGLVAGYFNAREIELLRVKIRNPIGREPQAPRPKPTATPKGRAAPTATSPARRPPVGKRPGASKSSIKSTKPSRGSSGVKRAPSRGTGRGNAGRGRA